MNSPVRWLLLCGALSAIASAQEQPASFRPPEDVAYREASILSEGSRLKAEVFHLKSNGEKPLPTVILCHGWGGTAEQLRPEALAFARAGYLAVTFDYRGWGGSEGRVMLTKPAAANKAGEPFAAEVKEIREVVDPIEQTTDLQNVIHWVHGEKQCDPQRIGLWGSSFSGGHVVYAAARDPRVKATVSQVPALDARWTARGPMLAQSLRQATQRARGEISYPPTGAKVIGNLRGAPILEKMTHYAPVEDVAKASSCAMLFVLAENEELFDNKEHGILAHERAKGPKKLVIIPGIRHYDIYGKARDQAQKLAIEWFDEHLRLVEKQ